MIATKYRELNADEYRVMLEGVQRVIQPYMLRKLEVMQLTMPIITSARTDTGYTMTASYPPDVQEHFDRCDRMCEQDVAQYLRQEGYTVEVDEADLPNLKRIGAHTNPRRS